MECPVKQEATVEWGPKLPHAAKTRYPEFLEWTFAYEPALHRSIRLLSWNGHYSAAKFLTAPQLNMCIYIKLTQSIYNASNAFLPLGLVGGLFPNLF